MSDNHGDIIRTAMWSIESNEYADGYKEMRRVNDGFDAFELLGMVEYIRADLLEQIAGRARPDIVKREVIKP